MSVVTVAEFMAAQRKTRNVPKRQLAQVRIDLAETMVCKILGYPLTEFEGPVPATVKAAVIEFASMSGDQLRPKYGARVCARVHVELRAYRRSPQEDES